MAAGQLEVLTLDQADLWLEVLRGSHRYDWYHLPAYHALAERQGEGTARLFVYRQDRYLVALPLLLRPVAAVPGLEGIGGQWLDATSVYGYTGPVASAPELPPAVGAGFGAALRSELRGRGVVSVFARPHPLLEQRPLLLGLGEVSCSGQTVSIDLAVPDALQRASYRENHRRDIRRLERLGLTCAVDPDWQHLDEFVDLYHDTMRRASAAPWYLFRRDYFEGLRADLASVAHLLVCHLGARLVCAGVFSLCEGIVQYHLGGTREEHLALAPSKLLLDFARRWGAEQGASVLHLGSGVGGREDSLFHFKAGFSDRRHAFTLWRWVVLPEVFDALNVARSRWLRERGVRVGPSDFFPSYRYPLSEGELRSANRLRSA